MARIPVLLVDDQKLFVENLKTVIDLTTEDLEVVGIAYDGEQAVRMVDELEPKIVLMDVRMPVMDGVQATRIIHGSHPDITIIMLTTFDNDDYVRDALENGAHGYLLKSIPPEKLLSSIRAAGAGGVLMSPEVATRMVRRDAGGGAPASERTLDGRQLKEILRSFSPREREVIEHIAMAYSNREIAEKMFISEQTVKNYISRIYQRLGVSRRSQLVKLYHSSD
jgi:DNA-binding NarL/FixJ family response regulator